MSQVLVLVPKANYEQLLKKAEKNEFVGRNSTI